MRTRGPVLAFVAASYAVGASTLDPYTWPMRAATALPIIGVVAIRAANDARARGAPARPVRRHAWGYAGWGVLFVAAGSMQLAMYLSTPRVDHPTLSSFAGASFGQPLVRAAGFAAWLWLGWLLAQTGARTGAR